MTQIVSHSDKIDYLENVIQKNRIAPAYLFIGRKGIGKFTFAQAIGKKLTNNLTDIYTIEPTYINEGEIISVKDAIEKGLNKKTKPLIRIEQIREISEIVSRKPLGNQNSAGFSAKNVIIVDDIQNIQEDGMNALLKNLEEPGIFSAFILVCSGNVSDTIISRCQVLNFGRLSQQNLLEIAKLNNTDITSVIDICDGSYGEAIAIKQMLDEVPEDLKASLESIVSNRNVLTCLQLARDIANIPHHHQIVLMEYSIKTIWSKHFDKKIVQLFDDAISKLKAGMQSRLTLEALFLELTKI